MMCFQEKMFETTSRQISAMSLSVALVLVAPMAGTQTHADPLSMPWNENAAIARFQTCYAEAQTMAAARSCTYIRPCIDASQKNSTVTGMLACAVTGAKIWDDIVLDELKQLNDILGGMGWTDAQADLAQSQNDWMRYRNSECRARISRSPLARSAAEQSCRAALTAERALSLREDSQFWTSR